MGIGLQHLIVDLVPFQLHPLVQCLINHSHTPIINRLLPKQFLLQFTQIFIRSLINHVTHLVCIVVRIFILEIHAQGIDHFLLVGCADIRFHFAAAFVGFEIHGHHF